MILCPRRVFSWPRSLPGRGGTFSRRGRFPRWPFFSLLIISLTAIGSIGKLGASISGKPAYSPFCLTHQASLRQAVRFRHRVSLVFLVVI